MRKGFQLFDTRLVDENINLEVIQEQYSIVLPPLYRLFLETFKLPLLDSNNFIAYFPDSEVGFDNFNKDIQHVIQIYKEDESYNKHGMIPIASSGIHAGGICVCIQGQNIDRIFLDNEMYNGRFQLLANNIFEFVRGLIEVEDGEDLSIYKNLNS